MISKSRLVAGLAGLVLVAGAAAGSVSANAASATDTVVCAVDGSVTVTGGPALLGGANDGFAFTTTTITCANPLSPFAGTYDIKASGTTGTLDSNLGTGETCAQGSGSGSFTAGVTGSFSFVRVGTSVTVTGSISNGTASGTFAAELEFVPTSGPCVGGSGDTIAILAGTAVVEDVA